MPVEGPVPWGNFTSALVTHSSSSGNFFCRDSAKCVCVHVWSSCQGFGAKLFFFAASGWEQYYHGCLWGASQLFSHKVLPHPTFGSMLCHHPLLSMFTFPVTSAFAWPSPSPSNHTLYNFMPPHIFSVFSCPMHLLHLVSCTTYLSHLCPGKVLGHRNQRSTTLLPLH